MIFPTEISPAPRSAAETVTQNSGADVPNPTIVNPMINSETPNRLAIFEAESTNQFAPLQITMRLMTRIAEFEKISAANFLEQIEKGLVPAPGCENYEIDLFIAARDLLLKSGYIHYSIGNFAKPHYIDKHTIWYYKKQKDLFSHGPGAYGYINRCMYINRSGLTEYFKCVGKGFLPVNAVEKADEIEAMHGMMVKSLQAISVDRTDFVNLFNHDPLEQFQEKIKNLVQSELLEITDKEIRLTEKGIPWGYNVCKEFYSEKNKQSFIARIRPGKGRKSRSLVVSGNQMPKGT